MSCATKSLRVAEEDDRCVGRPVGRPKSGAQSFGVSAQKHNLASMKIVWWNAGRQSPHSTSQADALTFLRLERPEAAAFNEVQFAVEAQFKKEFNAHFPDQASCQFKFYWTKSNGGKTWEWYYWYGQTLC